MASIMPNEYVTYSLPTKAAQVTLYLRNQLTIRLRLLVISKFQGHFWVFLRNLFFRAC